MSSIFNICMYFRYEPPSRKTSEYRMEGEPVRKESTGRRDSFSSSTDTSLSRYTVPRMISTAPGAGMGLFIFAKAWKGHFHIQFPIEIDQGRFIFPYGFHEIEKGKVLHMEESCVQLGVLDIQIHIRLDRKMTLPGFHRLCTYDYVSTLWYLRRGRRRMS